MEFNVIVVELFAQSLAQQVLLWVAEEGCVTPQT
jgi:hypothetical protein